MKQIIKNEAAAWIVVAVGLAIIVAGILIMALYHNMPWLNYLIIGIIMLSAIWGIINLPISVSLKKKFVPIKNRNKYPNP